MKKKRLLTLCCAAMLTVASTITPIWASAEIGDALAITEGQEEFTPESDGSTYNMEIRKMPELYQQPETTQTIQPFSETYQNYCSDKEWAILYYTNQVRMYEGLQPLSMMPRLEEAAKIRSNELLTLFDHTRPNGTECFTILEDLGIDYDVAAENILYGVTDPYDAVVGWVNSQGHYANIVNPLNTHIGMGNSGNTYWTQLFTGSCTPTSISLDGVDSDITYVLPTGYTIDALGMTVVVQCEHGTSYLPLIQEMCSGYDDSKIGASQTVTVNYNNQTTTLKIYTSKEWKFEDVNSGDWFFRDVFDAYESDIMVGLNETTFGPAQPLSRAQFATILYRLEGEPAVSYSPIFPDVNNDGSFFVSPALWAAKNGVISGYDNGHFGPADNITREQLATILYRYYGEPSYSEQEIASILSGFPDGNRVSSFARPSIAWAIDIGLITGDKGNISPQGEASRAQCAAIILRFLRYAAE